MPFMRSLGHMWGVAHGAGGEAKCLNLYTYVHVLYRKQPKEAETMY